MTTEEFDKIVERLAATARHPRFNRPYTELVYQPMVELLAYLRANGFKTFIVSGGGVEFMRPWTERAYGIPPEQVVGSSGKTPNTSCDDGKPVLDQGAQGRVHRRRAGQAGRHQPLHRPPADLRLRQLRRRPADAAMDRRPATGARFMASSSTTPTPSANTPTTATPMSANSTRRSTRRPNAAGLVVDMKNDWKTIYKP